MTQVNIPNTSEPLQKSDLQTCANAFASTMRQWFLEHGRNLPWRHAPSPYQVWVSEIMLQQTQVVTVIPYYERWMARFPDIRSLALAPIEDVLLLWSGLGYYRRARYLHQGAKVIVERYGGTFPHKISELIQIPGIGAYTAGAIASFAFGENEPAIDGNVERVLSRYFGITDDLKRGPGRRLLEQTARAVADFGYCADINQAMMDLGASFCGKTPQCDSCPVYRHCFACRNALTGAIPYTTKRTEKYDEYRAVLRLRFPDGRYLIGRRKSGGLLGGLWEYPMMELSKGKGEGHRTLAESMIRLDRSKTWSQWLSALKLAIPRSFCTIGRPVSHCFTHIDLIAWIDEAESNEIPAHLPDASEIYDAFAIASPKEIGTQYPISTLMKKLIAVNR